MWESGNSKSDEKDGKVTLFKSDSSHHMWHTWRIGVHVAEKEEVNKERRKLTRSDLTNGTGGKFTTTHREYQCDDDDDDDFSIYQYV